MKRTEVRIGSTYIAKVTNKVVEVRIDAVNRHGGWQATNLSTGKRIHIKSPSRLHDEASQRGKADRNGNGVKPETEVVTDMPVVDDMTATETQVVAEEVGKTDNGEKEAQAMPEADTAQTVPNTGEPTANAEMVPVVCPNCSGTEVDEDGDCAKCHEPKTVKETSKVDRTRTPKATKEKRPSGLDAAAKVLEETGVPMNVKEITEVAFAKGYWKPAGRTPSATLASALMREIAKKGNESRFRKSERGKFVLNR